MAFKQTPRYYKGLYAPLNSSIIIIKQLFSAFTNELRVLTIIFSFVFLQNCTKYLVSCKAAMCAFLLEAWCCDCFQRTTKYWRIKTFRLSVVLAVVFFFWKSTYRVTSVRHRTYSKRTLVFDSFSRKWEISSVFFFKNPSSALSRSAVSISLSALLIEKHSPFQFLRLRQWKIKKGKGAGVDPTVKARDSKDPSSAADFSSFPLQPSFLRKSVYGHKPKPKWEVSWPFSRRWNGQVCRQNWFFIICQIVFNCFQHRSGKIKGRKRDEKAWIVTSHLPDNRVFSCIVYVQVLLWK